MLVVVMQVKVGEGGRWWLSCCCGGVGDIGGRCGCECGGMVLVVQ